MSDLRRIHDGIIDNPDFNLTVAAKRDLRQLSAENEAKDAEIERLRALLEMWLEVNDWDGPIGGLRHNTMLALQHKDPDEKGNADSDSTT